MDGPLLLLETIVRQSSPVARKGSGFREALQAALGLLLSVSEPASRLQEVYPRGLLSLLEVCLLPPMPLYLPPPPLPPGSPLFHPPNACIY